MLREKRQTWSKPMFAATSPFKAEIPHASPDTPPLFQRTTGALRLAFAARDGVTSPRVLFQEAALKVRLPKVRNTPPEAVMINTAGGLTGGDSISVAVDMDAGASAVVTGQACEKIYKSSGGEARIASTLTLAPGAALSWLVQPTILFDRGRMRRTMQVEMAGDATLLALEAIVFGRTAMDESVRTGFVSDTWRIRRQGKLVYADTFRIDEDAAEAVANPAVLAGNRAMASLVYVAPDAEARRDAMREIVGEAVGAAGAVSAWNGIMVTRLVAADGYALTQNLVNVLTRFRGGPLPRVWMI